MIEIIHDALREQVRLKKGKQTSPSLGLVDSQSVKTASVTEEKGVDGNKKVNGRKRFILTDTLGLLIGVLIVAANVGERAGAEKLFNETRGKYPRLKNCWQIKDLTEKRMSLGWNSSLALCLK